jgi:hypothetical protein
MQNTMLDYAPPPHRHMRGGKHVAVRSFACFLAAVALVAVGAILISLVRVDDWNRFFLGAAHYLIGLLLSLCATITAGASLFRHRDAAIWLALVMLANGVLVVMATWCAYEWLTIP